MKKGRFFYVATPRIAKLRKKESGVTIEQLSESSYIVSEPVEYDPNDKEGSLDRFMDEFMLNECEIFKLEDSNGETIFTEEDFF
jgi:hypothetical protein